MSPNQLQEACSSYLAEMAPLVSALEAKFLPDLRTVSLFAEAPENPELHDRLMEVYFDFAYHLPMGPPEVDRYRLELVTTDKGQACHRYVLESAISELPDTGGASQDQWARFLAQFVFTMDGSPQAFPLPEDFPDE